MDIGWAVQQMKEGKRVQRPGWNGKGMWIYIEHCFPRELREWNKLSPWLPCVIMHTAQGGEQPGWLCSQADLLADDWELCQETV